MKNDKRLAKTKVYIKALQADEKKLYAAYCAQQNEERIVDSERYAQNMKEINEAKRKEGEDE